MLLIDEIFSTQRVEYFKGKLYGVQDGSGQVCKTFLSFMIKSVLRKYNDLVSLVPIRNLESATLRNAMDLLLASVSPQSFYEGVKQYVLRKRSYSSIVGP